MAESDGSFLGRSPQEHRLRELLADVAKTQDQVTAWRTAVTEAIVGGTGAQQAINAAALAMTYAIEAQQKLMAALVDAMSSQLPSPRPGQ